MDNEEKIEKEEKNKEVIDVNFTETKSTNSSINHNNNTSKIIYIVYSLVIVLLILYIFFSKSTNKQVNVSKENIKTTTVEESSDLKEAIKNVYDSTIYIEVSNDRGLVASGSGFVYKKDDNFGYILTNYHVIEDGNKYVITFTDGKEVEAQYVNSDSYYDIAILKVSASAVNSVAEIGDSSELELGDTLFTVGAPLGKDYMGTITKGIVSGTNRMVTISIEQQSYMMDVIQTDASINSGNSGGPICNIKGQVVGITSSKLVGTGVEGMGFAIPINSVMAIIDSLETLKTIERPYLGVQLSDLNNTFYLQYYYDIKISNDVTFGAVLSYIEDGKPAQKAGLKVGDVIVEMDGKKIENASYFKYLLYKHSVGDKVKVKYYRENKLEETTIELSEAIKNN